MTRRIVRATSIVAAAYLAASTAYAADPERGRAMFVKAGCSLCHGTLGQGDSWMRPRIAPDPLPLALLRAKLRGASAGMPPYSTELLPDSEADNIHAYLRSVPPARLPAQVPLLHSTHK